MGPFLEKTLQSAHARIIENPSLFQTLLKYLKETLSEKKIHEANRTVISQLIETLFDKFNFDDKVSFTFMTNASKKIEPKAKYFFLSLALGFNVILTKGNDDFAH